MFQKDLLKDKRILVSGGGSGLGKAMATRYLELGADIYICGRRKSVLDEAFANKSYNLLTLGFLHLQKGKQCL